MMRSFAGAFGMVLAVCLATGCNRQCFLHKDVYDAAQTSMLPPSMERDPILGTKPLSGPTAPPPTLLSPDRPPRPLSLQEAIATAIEHGTASTRTLASGGPNGPGSGQYDTSMVNTPPNSGNSTLPLIQQSDNLDLIKLNPAHVGTNIEAALSRFDAHWITSTNWSVTDNLQQGLNSFNNGPSTSFQSTIVKALGSGGFVSTTFQQNYQLLTNPPAVVTVNPLYTSSLIVGFEQPLLRNFGVYINQLLSGTPSPTTNFGIPNQILNQYSGRQNGALQATGAFSNDGILIARLRFDQQRADFERIVQGLVLQVEVAYWNLYTAYGQLYSFEESLRVAHRAWMIAHAKYVAGQSGAAEYAPVKGQYEDFRTQRSQAIGAVLDAERNLRGIVGLPIEDGCRIIPITPPTLAHFQPDWESSVNDALNLRPELVLARDNFKLAHYNLEVAENFMKPDLRFGAQYQPIGFGNSLAGRGLIGGIPGGPVPANALQSLASGAFANYQLGLTLNVPLGFRLESAAVREAHIALSQSYYLIKDQEQKATSSLAQQYQKVQEWYKRIESTRASRKAYAEAVEVRFKKITAGKELPDISFLDFQTKLATAQAAEYQAIAEYNSTLARFEWNKGTILRYNNVHIAEGPLPQCTQIRAVDNEKQRTEARVLCERPDPLTHPARLAFTGELPTSDLPEPLPMMNPAPLQGPVIPEKLDMLPPPRPTTNGKTGAIAPAMGQSNPITQVQFESPVLLGPAQTTAGEPVFRGAPTRGADSVVFTPIQPAAELKFGPAK